MRYTSNPHEDDWYGDPDEAPEDGDSWEDDDEPTMPCPYCGEEVLEDAERCPHCERYISREDAPPAPRPWWIYLGVAVCLYVVYRWMFWL